MTRAAVIAAVLMCATACGSPRVLRVCADPDNLPFSNEARLGFENRIADLVAAEMGARVEYTWWPQRRGFLRNTLNAGRCDVVMGLPAAIELAHVTRPYYRSSYAFVSRTEDHLDLRSLDDERLRSLRVGVQLVGDDGANSPPAHAMSRRGIVRNVVGFPVYEGPEPIVRAVGTGGVDVAIVWGPIAGYHAARQKPALRVTPIDAAFDTPSLPLAFDIAMAVRRGDDGRRDELDAIIERRRMDIAAILASYHVPLIGQEGS